METKELFVDAVGRITVSGGMVRLDMDRLTPDGAQPSITAARLVIPASSFPEAYRTLLALGQSLVTPGEAGISGDRSDPMPDGR